MRAQTWGKDEIFNTQDTSENGRDPEVFEDRWNIEEEYNDN